MQYLRRATYALYKKPKDYNQIVICFKASDCIKYQIVRKVELFNTTNQSGTEST